MTDPEAVDGDEVVMAATDDVRSLEPPAVARPGLPAPTVSESALPPPMWSDHQRAVHRPPDPDDGAEGLPTDELDVVPGGAVAVNRTTILKSPGAVDRRLVRGADFETGSGDVVPASPSASSLPAHVSPADSLAALVADRSPKPPPPPPPTPPKPDPVDRPIIVARRREEAFASRSAAANPFPTHAPPMIIRRRRRRSGVGLVVTMLLLGGIIAAAVVFGRPVLFPDRWSDEARPYGEAVEAALAIEFDDPPDLGQVSPEAHRRGMLERFGGSWRAQLPMWRSLGLASSEIDEEILAGLLTDWQPAYFDPEGNVVIVDATATDADAHIATAMSVAALDQQFRWKARRDNAGLELGVLIDAQVRGLAREASASTTFGAADDDRPLAVATFLPPVLAYRVHGPLAFGELVPGEVSAPESIAPMSALGAAPSARLNDGEVLESTHASDRAFWYLVFAGYVDARRAYDASNGLSLATLTTARRGDVVCTYATFDGSSAEQTATLSAMLETWVAGAPAEMSATSRTRGDGVVQMRTCDPGAGFEAGTRFGVARELVRWRLVELAVRERAVALETDAEAAIAQVRLSGAAASLLGGGFDVTPQAEREAARQIAVDIVGR